MLKYQGMLLATAVIAVLFYYLNKSNMDRFDYKTSYPDRGEQLNNIQIIVMLVSMATFCILYEVFNWQEKDKLVLYFSDNMFYLLIIFDVITSGVISENRGKNPGGLNIAVGIIATVMLIYNTVFFNNYH